MLFLVRQASPKKVSVRVPAALWPALDRVVPFPLEDKVTLSADGLTVTWEAPASSAALRRASFLKAAAWGYRAASAARTP